MKVEILPLPQRSEVAIQLSRQEARELHNELYRLYRTSAAPGHDVCIRLMDALTAARVQHPGD